MIIKLNKKFTFLFLAPLMFLFAFGVVIRSLGLTTPNVASIVYDYNGAIAEDETKGLYHGDFYQIPDELLVYEEWESVLGIANPSSKWIEVDLSDQKLKAWDGNVLFLESAVSTGLPWWPTPTGEFRIWVKLRATKMEGGQGRYYYNLPNVPYVMFFENENVPGWRGYGLHGTYWHNDFGTPRSHGCVNLPTNVARELYYWAFPELPSGKTSVFSSPGNPGTRVVIHD